MTSRSSSFASESSPSSQQAKIQPFSIGGNEEQAHVLTMARQKLERPGTDRLVRLQPNLQDEFQLVAPLQLEIFCSKLSPPQQNLGGKLRSIRICAILRKGGSPNSQCSSAETFPERKKIAAELSDVVEMVSVHVFTDRNRADIGG